MSQQRNTAVRPAEFTRRRGTSMPATKPTLKHYERITPNTKLGLYRYPFLMPLMGLWVIVSALLNHQALQNIVEMLRHFATLAWLKDDKVVAIHVPGLSLSGILTKLRIAINMQGGLGKVSK